MDPETAGGAPTPLPGDPFCFGGVGFLLGMVGAECQVSRIPVRQSSRSHERTVGGCLASEVRAQPELVNVKP